VHCEQRDAEGTVYTGSIHTSHCNVYLELQHVFIIMYYCIIHCIWIVLLYVLFYCIMPHV